MTLRLESAQQTRHGCTKFDPEWCKFRSVRNLHDIPSDTSRSEDLSRILQQKVAQVNSGFPATTIHPHLTSEPVLCCKLQRGDQSACSIATSEANFKVACSKQQCTGVAQITELITDQEGSQECNGAMTTTVSTGT